MCIFLFFFFFFLRKQNKRKKVTRLDDDDDDDEKNSHGLGIHNENSLPENKKITEKSDCFGFRGPPLRPSTGTLHVRGNTVAFFLQKNYLGDGGMGEGAP